MRGLTGALNLFPDLSKCTSFEEIEETLRAHPLNNWYVGVRFNQEFLKEKQIPSKSHARFMVPRPSCPFGEDMPSLSSTEHKSHGTAWV